MKYLILKYIVLSNSLMPVRFIRLKQIMIMALFGTAKIIFLDFLSLSGAFNIL